MKTLNSPKMTRQGVRDLNSLGKPPHAHVWEHDPDCHCNCTWMLHKDEPGPPCLVMCACGERRRDGGAQFQEVS